jgi:hypothetical protein
MMEKIQRPVELLRDNRVCEYSPCKSAHLVSPAISADQVNDTAIRNTIHIM